MRDVDTDDENVSILACFLQQEGSKTRRKGTVSDGRGGGGLWVQREEVAKVKERARQRRKWQDVMRQVWEAVNW